MPDLSYGLRKEITMARLQWISLFLLLSAPAFAQKKDRNTQVREDRQTFADDDYWVYNDLDEGIARAKKTDRPLLIVFR